MWKVGFLEIILGSILKKTSQLYFQQDYDNYLNPIRAVIQTPSDNCFNVDL